MGGGGPSSKRRAELRLRGRHCGVGTGGRTGFRTEDMPPALSIVPEATTTATLGRLGRARSGSPSSFRTITMVTATSLLLVALAGLAMESAHVVQAEAQIDDPWESPRPAIMCQFPLPPANERNYVSVVVALKDRASTFRKAIRTWLEHQEVAEIVVVDWASKVPVRDLLTAWGIADPRINLIRVSTDKSFILSRAYNLGLKAATGNLVLKLDSDTQLDEGFFGLHPISATETLFYRGYWNDSRGKETDVSPLQHAVNHLNGVFFAPKHLVARVNGYDERMCSYGWEDESFYNRLDSRGAKREFFRDDVHHIAHHRSNLTTLDERATMFINLQSERRFGDWGVRNTLFTQYEFYPQPRREEGVSGPKHVCVAVPIEQPPCFESFFTPQQLQSVTAESRALSFMVACERCMPAGRAKRIDKDVQDALMHFYNGPATSYRFAVAILRGTSEVWDKKVLCQTVSVAHRFDLHVGVALDTARGGFDPVTSYARRLHVSGPGERESIPVDNMDRRFVLVSRYFPRAFSQRFFVAASVATMMHDPRHIVFGKTLEDHEIASSNVQSSPLIQQECDQIHREVGQVARWNADRDPSKQRAGAKPDERLWRSVRSRIRWRTAASRTGGSSGPHGPINAPGGGPVGGTGGSGGMGASGLRTVPRARLRGIDK